MTDTSSGPGRLPLSALLSQVLVAFIVEFDNEFERQMPHRTSDHGRTQGPGTVPWLVSMAMWSTCLRFGGETVTTLRQALDRLVSDPGARLSKGLEPLPGGWRASVRRPDTLAQYPMVLHRSGFPDGS
jgi:hypothetical protein